MCVFWSKVISYGLEDWRGKWGEGGKCLCTCQLIIMRVLFMIWSGLQYDSSLSRAKPLRSCVCLCCVDQGAGSREHHPVSHRWFPGSPGQERDPCVEISQSGAGWCAEKPAQDGAPSSLWVSRLGVDFNGVQQSLYLRHLFQCPQDWSDTSSSA